MITAREAYLLLSIAFGGVVGSVVGLCCVAGVVKIVEALGVFEWLSS